MIFREQLAYAELPIQLSGLFDESDFLTAYDCAENGSVLVWIINRELGKQQEIEYSLSLSRVLSVDEREKALPTSEEVFVEGVPYRVIKSAILEQGTNVRYEVYSVFSTDLNEKIVECDQMFASPTLEDVADIVRPAVERELLPSLYAKWPLDERVNYWVAILYRLRHQTAETGALEDDIFGTGLINKMKKIDTDVRSILPLILKRLAIMESISPVVLINSFNSRTGLSISPYKKVRFL
ncbi:hypothetical protein [Undibacterium pigrum]|uniref:Uncharacterized protein n=1 Tax=Undibacterium pigrum TaxID=401470 RepID=A0A318JE39_9BURK|nr:hypothetical protein [Undibacterium pigrum]PXX46786.1 hypothetical protein DFR42_101362 [Undibacterium pigrum]